MSTKIPENLKYTSEHEWTDIQSDLVSVGITDFAQSSLGDIVFVELPAVGVKLKKDSTFGVVESIKSVSDLYSPLSGTVVEKNTEVEENPEMINQNPYNCWLIKIKAEDKNEFVNLLSSSDYKKICEGSN